ncbi:MAG: P-II family nitrogen regulator [Bacillota bacterium]|nr:P-II family nitrogen regulator [Bacillota bacterium]
MTKIECILRPTIISQIKDVLAAFGINGMTVTEVIGCGFQKGHTDVANWNTELNINLMPKTKVEIVVPDSAVDEIIKTIIKTAKTGEIGDGKIFTSSINNAYRIRTEESGETAI